MERDCLVLRWHLWHSARCGKPGLQAFLSSPCCPVQLQFAEAGHDLPHRKIESQWKRGQQQMELRFKVSANTSATVYPPVGVVTGWRINGKGGAEAKGGISVDSKNNCLTNGAVFYSFVFSRIDSKRFAHFSDRSITGAASIAKIAHECNWDRRQHPSVCAGLRGAHRPAQRPLEL